MADTITEGTLQLAKDANATTSLTAKGKKYILTNGEYIYTPPAGVTNQTVVKLEGEELLQSLKSGLSKAAKSSAPLTDHAFNELQAVAGHLEAHPDYGSFLEAHNVVTGIKDTHALKGHMGDYVTKAQEVTTAKASVASAADATAKAAAESTLATAEAEAAAARTEVLKLLGKDASHASIPKAEIDAFKKALPELKSKKGWDILQTTVKDAKALTTQIAGTSFHTDAEKAAAQLKTILAKNHKAESGGISLLTDLLGDKAHERLSKVEGLEVHSAISEFSSEVAAAEGQLKTFAATTADLKKAVAAADTAGKGAAIEALKEHAKDVEEYFKLEEHAAARGAAFRDAPASIRATLNADETIKAAASKASSGLGVAGKAVETGAGTWFTKSAEELAKVAEKDGKQVEQLGKWARRTGTGKAVIGAAALAGAYGLYSVIAGTGNKGPGENAARVRGQENEPAMGGGRA